MWCIWIVAVFLNIILLRPFGVLPNTVELFGFQNFWLWTYLMKIIPETYTLN
jgi:hypothetical protein